MTDHPGISSSGAAPRSPRKVDLEYIRDRKALTKVQIADCDRYGVPNLPVGAIELHSRFKLIAYSQGPGTGKPLGMTEGFVHLNR